MIYEKYRELYLEEKACHLYTIPEKRRNGYSSKIMEELLKWFKSKGVHDVKLKPSNAGKHLYEKFGFCDSGEMELWI